MKRRRSKRLVNLIQSEYYIVSDAKIDADYRRDLLRLRGYMCRYCTRLLGPGGNCNCRARRFASGTCKEG